MKLTIYTSSFSKRHDTGHGHPESPARIEMLEELFTDNNYTVKQSNPAALEQIMLAHDEDYIFDLQDKTPEHGLVAIDGDTILSPDTYDAALHAAGAVCNAVDDLFTEDSETEPPRACAHEGFQNARAFCATRPPGHHAEPDQAMGFCFFNNIFIGARHAQEQHGIKKIAIVDFDVHHGNGTETMCRAHNKNHPDQPILYISSHGHPQFPMSGDPVQNDETTLNIHLPDGCNSDQFRTLYEDQVFPALEEFQPDLLMLSSGFDAHRLDPLADINLETEDFGWITQKLCDLADKHAKGRMISVLEGGYALEPLKECVHAHLIALEN